MAEGVVGQAFDDGAGVAGDGVDGAEGVFVQVAGGAGAVALEGVEGDGAVAAIEVVFVFDDAAAVGGFFVVAAAVPAGVDIVGGFVGDRGEAVTADGLAGALAVGAVYEFEQGVAPPRARGRLKLADPYIQNPGLAASVTKRPRVSQKRSTQATC